MYEVVSGDVIYPPSGVDKQTLALDIHLEFQVNGIFANPIFVREMQIASKALNITENAIGSKFGTALYPYAMDGTEFDYKLANPIKVYKEKNPYLYLSEDSGIGLVGTAASGTRGIYLKINKDSDAFYQVSTISLVMKYPGELFPASKTEIFNIEDTVMPDKISFYITPTNTARTRAKITAESSGGIYYDTTIFINGKPTSQSEININQWNAVGIYFKTPLDFRNTNEKKFKILGKILTNEVSFFQVSQEESSQLVSEAPWSDVATGGFWTDYDELTWYDLLIEQSIPALQGISPESVFEIYTGTHKLIPNDGSTATLKFTADGYRAYLNYSPLTYTITPA
jgi:hypothetical protein